MTGLVDTLCYATPATVVVAGKHGSSAAAPGTAEAAVLRWLADRPRVAEVGFTVRGRCRLVALCLGEHATFLMRPAEAAALAERLARQVDEPMAVAIAAAMTRVGGADGTRRVDVGDPR